MHWLLVSRGAVNHVHISVPNIRKKMFFEAASALLGLPSASMFLLGIHECLLCSEVLNVETQHSSFDINTSQRFGGLICFHVSLISIPLVVYILRIMTLVFTFLKGFGRCFWTKRWFHKSSREWPVGLALYNFASTLYQSISRLSYRCLDCMSLRSRRKTPISIGTNDAWRVVIVGQNCF